MVSVGNALIFAAVKQLVEANAKIARSALFAVGIVATTAANVFDMQDAKEKWAELSNDLGTLTQHMDNALAAGDDWIADDKDAFEASMINFKGEIEKLKTATSTVGSVLEVAANAYIVAYVAIALFAGACLVILLGLLVLLVIPHTSAFARAAIETIGALLVSVSAKIAVLLGAATTVMAGILATTVYAAMQIDSKTKSIPTPAELRQIQIDYAPPTRFVAKDA